MEKVHENTWRKQIKPARLKEEKGLLKKILGLRKDLKPETVSEFDTWSQLFHEEVHGSRFTLAIDATAWFRNGQLPSVGPAFDRLAWENCMQRAAEIAWLVVRLLPYLQLVGNAFGDGWQDRYEILDKAFRSKFEADKNAGNECADAVMELVEKRFSFGDAFHYREADGSARQDNQK